MERRFYIASYPRSGNTMVRMLVRHHFGIDAPSEYYESRMPGEDGHPLPIVSKDEDPLRTAPSLGSGFFVWKTHELIPPERVAGALVVVRNGLDAIVSYAHFHREINGDPRLLSELLAALSVDGSWSAFHAHWLSVPNIAVLRYEELVLAGPTAVGMLSAALDFIGIPAKILNHEPLPAFDRLRQENPLFFRRGAINGWLDEIPRGLSASFIRENRPMLNRLGYVM